MNRFFYAIIALFFFFKAISAEETHPRLWVTPERLAVLKTAVQNPQTHPGQAFNALKTRVSGLDPEVYGESPNYNRSYYAMEAAFLHLLTGDSVWANASYSALQELYHSSDDGFVRKPDEGYALGRATSGLAFAMAYDFCYQGWEQDQKDWVRGIIVKSLNEWTEREFPKNRGNHNWSPYHSNWVAVARGAELIMMLAVYEENQQQAGIYKPDTEASGVVDPFLYTITRKMRFDYLKTLLMYHMQNAYGNLGVTGEGFFYGTFAGSFLMPAIYALQSAGDFSLLTEFEKHQWWKLALYQQSFSSYRHILPSGNANLDYYPNGWSSLVAHSVPGDKAGIYRFFLDKLLGIESQYDDIFKFDGRRAGTIWSILYYPDSVAAVNPGSVMSSMAVDTSEGFFFIRSGWGSGRDVMISLAADSDGEEDVHNQAEAMQLGLIVNQTMYAAGVAGKADPEKFSAVLVDGKAFLNNENDEPADTGAIVSYRGVETGIHAIVSGAQKYQRLGLDSATRHLHADLSNENVILSVMDRFRSTTSHLYQWQLHVPSTEKGGPVSIETGNESNRKFVLMRGDDDSFCKIWLLHPQNAVISSTNPLRFDVDGSDQEIWTLMVAGVGNVPEAEISGQSLATAFTSGGRRHFWNGMGLESEDDNTVVLRAAAPNPHRQYFYEKGVIMRWIYKDKTIDASGKASFINRK